MKKKTQLYAVVVSLVLSLILMITPMFSFAQAPNERMAQEGKIHSEVLQRFDSGEDHVEVLVKMKERASTGNTTFSSVDERTSSREELVNNLENTALRSQSKLLNFVSHQEKLGQVLEYQSYYIVNMVYVKASKEVIEEIAAMDEVEKVYFNERVYLIGAEQEEQGQIEVLEPEEEAAVGGFSVEEGVEELAEQDVSTSAASSSDIEWNIKQVQADKVWNNYDIDGTGVVVGMIDTGVTWNHPALKNKYRGYNPSTGTVNHSASWFDAYAGRSVPYDESSSPHGTHVMGTILGQEASGRNAIGVAPGAKFIVAKGLGPYGGSGQDLLAAAQWMLRPGGSTANAPDVICNSWGGGEGINSWFRDAVRAWRAAGILPVFAAGNQLPGEPLPWPGSISVPSNYPESFAVGATDSRNIRGSFSKLGPSPYDQSLPKPDISAPGVNIRSSVINGYASGWSGTSMAAPNVTGVAALMLQANRNLSISEIERVIKSTATPLTDSTYTTSPNMGYGYGLVNALKAVQSVRGGELPPTPPVDQTGTVSGRITNANTGSGISGATITITGTSLSARTDSYGYYTLEGVPAGTRTLVCKASGYYEISGSITVQANRTITINGTMVPSQAVSEYGVVTGKVVNTSGYALSCVRVRIDGTSLSTYTSRDGTFTLSRVPAGTQTIRFTNYGYQELCGSIPVTAGKTLNLNVRMARTSSYSQEPSPTPSPVTPAPVKDLIEKPIIEIPPTQGSLD